MGGGAEEPLFGWKRWKNGCGGGLCSPNSGWNGAIWGEKRRRVGVEMGGMGGNGGGWVEMGGLGCFCVTAEPPDPTSCPKSAAFHPKTPPGAGGARWHLRMEFPLLPPKRAKNGGGYQIKPPNEGGKRGRAAFGLKNGENGKIGGALRHRRSFWPH